MDPLPVLVLVPTIGRVVIILIRAVLIVPLSIFILVPVVLIEPVPVFVLIPTLVVIVWSSLEYIFTTMTSLRRGSVERTQKVRFTLEDV